MQRDRTNAIFIVYAASFLAGLALVSLPASSAMLRDQLGLSNAQYGQLFIPQLFCAILGSFLCSLWVKRLGLKIILLFALTTFAVSEALFGGLPRLTPIFPFACLSAGLLGLGLGLVAGPMNTYPSVLFPARRDAALVAAHSCAGVGLTLGPTIAAMLSQRNLWSFFPFGLSIFSVLLLLLGVIISLPKHAPGSQNVATLRTSLARKPLFWIFVLIVVAYAFAEGVFHNWGILFLKEEKHVDPRWAALALSVFWGTITFSRAASSLLLFRLSPWAFWLTLPFILIACYLSLGFIHGPLSGVLIFAWAGAGCSAFFPLTLSLAGRAFPDEVERVTSLLVAAVIAGGGFCAYGYGALRSHASLETLFHLSVGYPILMLLLVWYTKQTLKKE